MTIRTLDEFLKKVDTKLRPKSEYVSFKGFQSLYIRFGAGYIRQKIINFNTVKDNPKKYENVLTIASMTVQQTGKGTLKGLFKHIAKKHQYISYIVIENILFEQLEEYLSKNGFEILFETCFPYSYFIKMEEFIKRYDI